MELIILGSGTGVPSIKRGSPGALVKAGGTSLLLDGGSGTLVKMLQAGVTCKDLDDILYSHIHPDHVADLVPLIFAGKYQEDPREKDLSIIGGPGFRHYFEGLRWVYGAWVEPESFRIHIREVLADDIHLEDIRVTTLPLDHAPQSVGYRIESPEGRTLVYSGDTDYCRNIVELAIGVDLLLLEASFPDTKKVKGHLTPSLAGRIAREAGCKRLILTHFYPPCDHFDMKTECQRIYDGEVLLAEDMLRVEV